MIENMATFQNVDSAIQLNSHIAYHTHIKLTDTLNLSNLANEFVRKATAENTILVDVDVDKPY